ncbi:MAG: hypothetical protein F7C81_01900 [Desulfurococcales archaeon]|nr:hypothetical protein [Desulfurococcales archaeon]
MIIRNRIIVAVIVFSYLLLMSIAYTVYIDAPMHKAVVISGYNGDIVYYNPNNGVIVANGVGTSLLVNRSHGVILSESFKKACTSGSIVYGITESVVEDRNRVFAFDGKAVYAMKFNVSMPDPKLLYCNDDGAIIVGGDIVRGIAVYIISGFDVDVYYIPYYKPALRDVLLYNNTLYILFENSVIIAELMGNVTILTPRYLNTSFNLDRLHLYKGHVVALGSVEYEDSNKLYGAIVYIDKSVMDIIRVGNRNSKVEVVSYSQGISHILVRPSGDWAKIVEVWRDRPRGVVSIVMSESFVMTASGSYNSKIWIGGRLPASGSMIVYEGSSTRPAYIGEGYYIVVEVKPYDKDLVFITSGVEIDFKEEHLEAMKGPFTTTMEQSQAIEIREWSGYDLSIYKPYIDRWVIFLTLLTVSIPSTAILYRLLGGFILD